MECQQERAPSGGDIGELACVFASLILLDEVPITAENIHRLLQAAGLDNKRDVPSYYPSLFARVFSNTNPASLVAGLTPTEPPPMTMPTPPPKPPVKVCGLSCECCREWVREREQAREDALFDSIGSIFGDGDEVGADGDDNDY